MTGQTATPTFTKAEMMIVAAARELAPQRVCFVGVGLPNIAVNLAKRTVAPDLELVYEAGVFGARPARLPLSIGDPTIVTGATAVTSMFELFTFYLQGGLIDVGFLGAAQIDSHANLNTTAIGSYEQPKVRLPGAGGAPEIAACAKSVIVIVRHSPRTFVTQLDFVTSLAHRRGHTGVITDLGVLRPAQDGELELVALHPDVEVEQVQEATGWELRVAAEVERTPPVTQHELDTLRELRASARH